MGAYLEFNGIDDGARTVGVIPETTPPWTWGAWFKLRAVNVAQTIMGMFEFPVNASIVNSQRLIVNAANVLQLGLSDDTGPETFTNITVPATIAGQTWYHVMLIVRANNDRTVVVNGDWANRTNVSTNIPASAVDRKLVFGRRDNGNNARQFFNGWMQSAFYVAAVPNQEEVTHLSSPRGFDLEQFEFFQMAPRKYWWPIMGATNPGNAVGPNIIMCPIAGGMRLNVTGGGTFNFTSVDDTGAGGELSLAAIENV